MGFRLAVLYILLMVVGLHLVVEDLHDCHNRCYMRLLNAEAGTVVNHSRKLLLLGSEEVFKSSFAVPNDRQSVDLVGSGLRTVPSGPDPLHHNSRAPKKPQTP